LVLWPSGEITSLIKNSEGKPSFTLPHCTDPFNFRNSINVFCKCAKIVNILVLLFAANPFVVTHIINLKSVVIETA
jgi:hypothetical protein